MNGTNDNPDPYGVSSPENVMGYLTEKESKNG